MFTIQIKKISEPVEGKSYPLEKTIYEQTLETLDLEAVIAVVNGLTKEKKAA